MWTPPSSSCRTRVDDLIPAVRGAGRPAGALLPGAEAPPTADGLPAIRLERVEISDGTLTYDAPGTHDAGGTAWAAEAIHARLSAHTLQGPFTLAGTARVAGRPLAVDGRLGALGGGPAPLELSLNAGEGTARAGFGGRLTPGEGGPTVSGTLEADAPRLDSALALLAGWTAPPALARPAGLEARIEADAGGVAAEDLAVTLGPARARGQLTADFGETPAVDL